jgi:hypothetical protein
LNVAAGVVVAVDAVAVVVVVCSLMVSVRNLLNTRGTHAVGCICILAHQGVEAKTKHCIVGVGAVVKQALHDADLEVIICLADAVGIVQIFALGFLQKFRHTIRVSAHCERYCRQQINLNVGKLMSYGWWNSICQRQCPVLTQTAQGLQRMQGQSG